MAIQCRKDQIAFEKMTMIENILGDNFVFAFQKDECTDAKWLGKLIIPGIGDRDCCSAIFPFPIFQHDHGHDNYDDDEAHDHDLDDYDDIGHLLARRLWRSILQKHCTSQFGVSLYQCGSMVYQCDTPNLTRLLLARPSTRQAWHLIITLEKTFLSRCGLL